jgi:hypothetical protein
VTRRRIVALVDADPHRGRLGHARSLGARLGHTTVLGQTLHRIGAVPAVTDVVVVHPADAALEIPDASPTSSTQRRLPIATHAASVPHDDGARRRIVAARQWAHTAWRGGLGQATAWDELLPADPFADALAANASDADVVLLLGGDWCLVDPDLTASLIERFEQSPEAFKLVFAQAPPGLSPVLLQPGVLRDLAEHRATLGRVLGYNPSQPSLDPIGKDVCVAVPAHVRDLGRRLIHDTPRAIAHLRAIAEHLGPALPTADADAIADASRAVELTSDAWRTRRLPPQWFIELTPHRDAAGPITPQHHVQPDRGPLDVALARDLFAELAEVGDVAVMLGGIGEPLRHPRWTDIVTAAADAGIAAIGLTTDLLADRETIAPLMDLPLDVLQVRLNADRPDTYAQVMGVDPAKWDHVMGQLQWLIDQRLKRDGSLRAGLPWLVPTLVKTAGTLRDMESFFERWLRLGEHPVIERFDTGLGRVNDLSPVPMDPPPRAANPHAVPTCAYVLADGSVTLCLGDWLGERSLGQAEQAGDLLKHWQSLARPETRRRQRALGLTAGCEDWLRGWDTRAATAPPRAA